MSENIIRLTIHVSDWTATAFLILAGAFIIDAILTVYQIILTYISNKHKHPKT